VENTSGDSFAHHSRRQCAPLLRALSAFGLAASGCQPAIAADRDLAELRNCSSHGTFVHALAAACRTTAIALLLAIVQVSSSFAEAPPVDEARVKAAFVLRFVQYVEWPREALQPNSDPVKIGVFGAPAIAAELVQAARNNQPRPITVQPLSGAENAGQFHVVFIGDDEKARLASIMAAVRGKPTLVITESPGALDQGSMINFVTVERRVKFEIALVAAEKAGLALSSRLLAVALRVHKGGLDRADMIARAIGRPHI
jgi:hypothetical protein